MGSRTDTLDNFPAFPLATRSRTVHGEQVDPLALLVTLGAPPRLVTHGRLVLETAEALLEALDGLDVDRDLVRAGAVLHDCGKTTHPEELSAAGHRHEEAGQALLLESGVDASVARCCVSHSRWGTLPCSLEELLVALADKLWKGVRVPELEAMVIDEVALRRRQDRWACFIELDSCFERIADAGPERLRNS
jgi:putative nucleotidyltransferase with HDIG domain